MLQDIRGSEQTHVSLEDAGLSLHPPLPGVGRGSGGRWGRGAGGGQLSEGPTGFWALQRSGTHSLDTQTSQEMNRVLVLSGNSNSRPANAVPPPLPDQKLLSRCSAGVL